jgi:curved DNA-binding protein
VPKLGCAARLPGSRRTHGATGTCECTARTGGWRVRGHGGIFRAHVISASGSDPPRPPPSRMTDANIPDHYDVLQLSPHADQDTVERVFRHLAKRYHPDNPESGDSDRFSSVLDAFRTLSDPEQRARYDARYQEVREARWRIFDQKSATSEIGADRRIRAALLALLYTARRNDADRPGLGIVELEQLLGCPEEHMKFHIWYLKENGWLQRMENGTLAITASGVDRVLDMGGPGATGQTLLGPGNGNGDRSTGEREHAMP